MQLRYICNYISKQFGLLIIGLIKACTKKVYIHTYIERDRERERESEREREREREREGGRERHTHTRTHIYTHATHTLFTRLHENNPIFLNESITKIYSGINECPIND